ncbi:hypothetical protein JCM16303_002614 [Sporobolomyces ruberrimus]
MTSLERPPAPLRTYSESLQADVNEAVSSNLLQPSPLEPTTPSPDTPRANRRRAPMLGNGDQLRRRRSNDEIRLPPTEMGDSRSTGGADSQRGSRQSSQERIVRPGFEAGIRRANSADLLSLVDDLGEDDNSDAGFSSEEEPFRFRPPSIASTTTSQHSSRRGIRIEDASNRDNKIFVKQISIPAYHAVGSEGSGFVVFDIEIQTLPTSSSQGTLIRAHKRYSAFVRLRADLIAEYPRLRRAIPRLPPKSSLAKYRPSFLDKRRQNLAFWLGNVLLHPVLGGSQIARAWVLD